MHDLNPGVNVSVASFAIAVSGGERARRFLWCPIRPKCQIVRRHIDRHREQDEGCGNPKERAMVDSLPMKTMHRVWFAVLLKLGIIHRAGDRCEKCIGRPQQAILATPRIAYRISDIRNPWREELRSLKWSSCHDVGRKNGAE